MATPDSKKKETNLKQFAKYSGLAFQLFASIAIAGFIGQKLDDYFGLQQDYLTIVLILIVFFGIMYKMVKDLS